MVEEPSLGPAQGVAPSRLALASVGIPTNGMRGEFAAEVGDVALAVVGVVQDGVDVMEDVPLGDG